MPPTVAGPMMILLLARAKAINVLVSRSGTPSAMTATTRIVGCLSASNVDSKALQNETTHLSDHAECRTPRRSGRKQAWRQ